LLPRRGRVKPEVIDKILQCVLGIRLIIFPSLFVVWTRHWQIKDGELFELKEREKNLLLSIMPYL
jgi:hypothetical protein